jgi:AraC-like DNA-binding protein
MIESGSHKLGISAADFALPPYTALRYEKPADALCPYIPSYFVLDSEFEEGRFGPEWLLPTWAQIWIVMAEGPVTIQIGNRAYERLPTAVLYGVTSRAMPVSARGGVTIGLDVSPLGWARLFRQSAEQLRDQVAPLETVMRPELARELTQLLARSDHARDVKGLLDTFFRKYLGAAHPDEPLIGQILALIADQSVADLTAAARARGIDPRAIRRVSKRYFGFPPKLLMMRTRFIRALIPLLDGGSDADADSTPRGYHDRSHFIRDARRFLGMTPRQFLKQKSPYAAAARRARKMVIGAAVPSLDVPHG